MPDLRSIDAIVTEQQKNSLARAIDQVNTLVVGKPQQVKLAFVAVLAGGHLLLEDVPGLGKTTLAHALAQTLGLGFKRVQFTTDLLPADVIGVSIHEPQHGRFVFHPGPVFTGVLLADEINRAPPRTQSALLEAMAEHQVTVDGVSHPLPDPFLVIATQNPTDLSGTFPLPDSQLDRFTLRLSLGYPSPAAERALLRGEHRRQMIANSPAQLDAASITALRQAVTQVHVSDALLDYLQALLAASRQHADIATGLSPRAGLALLQSARAHALLRGRGHVLPDDIQAVFVALAGHRLVAAGGLLDGQALAQTLLARVAVD
ncbi:ATPase [Stenotrophomonas ginsengisoli]|uniref:ATPase n=1 Tax=Stenotrophomonas ginsengisoli TaxID=336566 RepID=A0A0R0DA59_9GAMM|nr:MoxR family ATPase [Stenotrophomonas ginsengisoli]KRG79151.1 ATPase [Stenotrophomonas ginsengisoli]